MTVRALAHGAAAAVLLVGCTPKFEAPPADPLYAGPQLPSAQVARAFGSLASIDGRDVSGLGSAFELLPGCHVVRTRNEAMASTNAVTVVGKAGAASFALWAKPGHAYYFRRDEFAGEMHGSVQRGGIGAVTVDDRDSAGTTQGVMGPAKDAAELAACRDGKRPTGAHGDD